MSARRSSRIWNCWTTYLRSRWSGEPNSKGASIVASTTWSRRSTVTGRCAERPPPIAGGVRDLLLLICAILFTGVWWSVDRHKSSWLPMFVVLIVISVSAAGYAFSGLRRFLLSFLQRKD
jgi:hypothetical protein